MILAAVDDLLFSSKIRTTARQAGVAVSFARTPAEILAVARTERPSLVIIDLNAARLDPIATVMALKREVELAGIPTLGFVSHVHAEIIEAARRAGVERVMARSVFAGQLAEILASYSAGTK